MTPTKSVSLCDTVLVLRVEHAAARPMQPIKYGQHAEAGPANGRLMSSPHRTSHIGVCKVRDEASRRPHPFSSPDLWHDDPHDTDGRMRDHGAETNRNIDVVGGGAGETKKINILRLPFLVAHPRNDSQRFAKLDSKRISRLYQLPQPAKSRPPPMPIAML
ncbi:hypothetical protein ANO11243_041940 [Dothideomycetidae sp. 11243]|nr:hypothetical protein ANO11243_041940 [fungal sp. No.11243]